MRYKYFAAWCTQLFADLWCAFFVWIYPQNVVLIYNSEAECRLTKLDKLYKKWYLKGYFHVTYTERYVRLTTLPFKPFSGQWWGRYPNLYTWTFSTGRLEVTVYTVLSLLVYTRAVSWHLISCYINKNTTKSLIKQRLKGYRCKSDMALHNTLYCTEFVRYSQTKLKSTFTYEGNEFIKCIY